MMYYGKLAALCALFLAPEAFGFTLNKAVPTTTPRSPTELKVATLEGTDNAYTRSGQRLSDLDFKYGTGSSWGGSRYGNYERNGYWSPSRNGYRSDDWGTMRDPRTGGYGYSYGYGGSNMRAVRIPHPLFEYGLMHHNQRAR